MNWLYLLLGKLGHVNGNMVHRDLAETKGLVSAIRAELSTIKNELSATQSIVGKLADLESKDVCDRFHISYYDSPERTWDNTYWLGTRLAKYPTDLWVYQEILCEVKPDVIIECGTFHGGSALFLASICALLDHGRVITIDVQPRDDRPKHSRICYLTGSSVEHSILQRVKPEVRDGDRVLVILDSDHSKSHVLAELTAYSPLVSVGSFLIVEDTNINGHPVYPDFGPGPMEAVQEFLKSHPEFAVDASREKFYISANPKGYLKKMI